MSGDRSGRELDAYRRLTKLIEEARELKRFFDESHMATPEPLTRLLGGGGGANGTSSRMTIPPPPVARPSTAREGWIYVPVASATPTTLVRVLLAAAGSAVEAKEVSAAIAELRPDVNPGSIANIGTRLDGEGAITRTEDGWRLVSRENAPVQVGDVIWGPLEAFERQEIAAYRRQAIEHVLRSVPDGLQIVQIAKTLAESCPWFDSRVAMTKDQIKMDMEALADDGRMKRVGHSGKWTVVG